LVERNKELDEAIRYIVDMINGELSSLTILGFKGIGKTHFILNLHIILKNIFSREPDLFKKFDLVFLTTLFEFSEFYKSYFSEIKKKDTFLIIDDGDQIWQKYPYELKELYDKKNVVILSTWNSSRWNSLKKKSIALPRSKTMILKKISPKGCINIMKSRLQKNIIDKKRWPFTFDAIELLAELCDGNPYTLMNTADKCLNYALEKKLDIIDRHSVIATSTDIGLFSRNVRKKLFDLTRSQLTVLKQIWEMTTSYKRGITASEIAKELGITRSAVVQHLRNLGKKQILHVSRVKKEVLYSINPDILEYVEKFIQLIDEGIEGV